MIVLPDAENRTIVSSFIWTKHRDVTDGRTDGQNRSGYYSRSCLHCEQCGRTVKTDQTWLIMGLVEFAGRGGSIRRWKCGRICNK